MATEYLALKEAAAYLGVSRLKMWRMVKQGTLSVYSDPLDRRKRLVKKDDIEALKHPRAMP